MKRVKRWISLDGIYNFIQCRRWLRVGILAGTPFLVLFLFFVLPYLEMVRLSLLSDLPPYGEYTLENYVRLLDSVYLTILWRTTVITLQTTAVVGVLGYTLAYSIVRFSRRTTLLLLLVLLPFWTNYIVRMYALINIFQGRGLINWTLGAFGYGPIQIMYTQEAVLIGLAYVWLPLAVLPFYASLASLNTELIDASKDLGAGPIKTFFKVTLPLTSKGVITGLLLVAIPSFGAFITPELLGGINNYMIGNVIDQQFNYSFNYPFGAAVGIFVSLIVLLLLTLGLRLGFDAFSIKGENK